MAKKSELKKWAKEHFKGIENVLLPSFTPDFSALDEDGIRWDVQQSIRHGFFSMLCAVESGLSWEEAKRFVAIAADEANGKIACAVTLLNDSHTKNMEMIAHGEKVGCTHFLMGYPANMNPKSPEEIMKATLEMCDATNLPMVLYPSPHYNFERFHHSGFPIDLMVRMADIDNVVAIKVGEPGLISECLRGMADKILISCPIERWWPMCWLTFKQQWIGAGPYEFLQSPEKPYMVEYSNLMMEGKMDQAMEIFWKITPARVIFEMSHMPVMMLGTYPWTQYKFYQWCVGGNGGVTRQPSMKIHQHEMEQIRMAYRMIGINPKSYDEEFYMGRSNFAKAGKRIPEAPAFPPFMQGPPGAMPDGPPPWMTGAGDPPGPPPGFVPPKGKR
jgi:4-hydroxy-tetrahydrodipicolinate synthase